MEIIYKERFNYKQKALELNEFVVFSKKEIVNRAIKEILVMLINIAYKKAVNLVYQNHINEFYGGLSFSEEPIINTSKMNKLTPSQLKYIK